MSLETHIKEMVPDAAQRRGRPVLVYILLLFIAAFLLMALSFAAHQRSNEQAIGNLETSIYDSIRDMQIDERQVQALQDENAALKAQLTENQQQSEKISAALGDVALSLQNTAEQLDAAEKQLRAMEQLYCLQQWYAAGNYTACAEQIGAMESNRLHEALSDDDFSHDNGTTPSPRSQFLEIKEAVTSALATASAE